MAASMAKIAEKLSLSRTHVQRVLRFALGQEPVAYIRVKASGMWGSRAVIDVLYAERAEAKRRHAIVLYRRRKKDPKIVLPKSKD